MKLEIFAYCAVPLLQLSTYFQIHKMYKRKTVGDISPTFWWMVFIGLIFYQIFALANWIVPYIVSNGIGLILTAWLLILYYQKRR